MRQEHLPILPVILSGGSGTRLWPLSREAFPKQLFPLMGARSLLQETVLRVAGDRYRPPMLVCNHEHRFIAAHQTQAVGVEPSALVIEPVGRNTAPAVAVSALLAMRDDPDVLLLVLPSDHVVADEAAFHEMVAAGSAPARQGRLVTFGIRPTSPATGYGYIKRGKALDANGRCHAVAQFTEKPDAATARSFVDSGAFLWNSGMFLFRADAMLDEMQALCPEILRPCREAVAAARDDLDFIRIGERAFAAAESVSIDHAVMEKTDRAVVVGADIGWSDLGSWSALWQVAERDGQGNAVSGDVVAVDTRNSLIRADDRLVATLGVEDLVVVSTEDAVLVANRGRAEEVKALVAALKAKERPELHAHREVFRPWGSYRTLDAGNRFQVKEIKVEPRASLSLQLHHHRAEHWVVVQGTARIVRGEETILLHENQSAYIPIGMPHRLENPGKIPLRLIEVQSGAYLGEDDIVRLTDHYGREAEETEQG